MKLSAIYTNQPVIFPLIEFHEGLNVVFAKVTRPEDLQRDAHNLGKTFLITVIEYGLLKNPDKEHPFKKHAVFGSFIFFLEVLTPSGQFVTVRREVEGRNAISINVAPESHVHLADLPPEKWTHTNLSLERARDILDGLLKLDALKPFPFRKGLGYFLRQQGDWLDEFRIARFAPGRDVDWKPYMAKVLGFNHKTVEEKYRLEEQIKRKIEERKSFELQAGSQSRRYDEIKGKIAVLESGLAKTETALGQFSFKQIESEISEGAASKAEERISQLNKERYTIDFELGEIGKSLRAEFKFDIKQIKEVYDEAKIAFPDSLVRGYQDLIEFNRKMSLGRGKRLDALRTALGERRKAIEIELSALDKTRQKAMAILTERATLQKYHELQTRLREQQGEIHALKDKLLFLDQVGLIEREILERQAELRSKVAEVMDDIKKGNSTYLRIRTTFSEMVESIINLHAILSVTLNANNNIDFAVQTMAKGYEAKETEQGKGTSYKKLLCACFDLAVLRIYSSERFFHFVYHDGVFEGLDNRKKVLLLDLIRKCCREYGIQYILTVLDTDLPRDENDGKLLFTEDEVIRELHDKDDSGRLFRMAPF